MLKRSSFCLTVCVALLVGRAALADVRIHLRPNSPKAAFVVEGLDAQLVKELCRDKDPSAKCAELLQVYVGREPVEDQPPLLGTYRVRDGRLEFQPRFALKPGIAYRVVLHRAVRPSESSEPKAPLVRILQLPKPPPPPPTTVRAIYPSSNVLPENQLKFYVHFSAPVRAGDSYSRVQLLDREGKKADLPFVNVGQELWDRSGTRLTLLLDPGRIKRGLRPREELGPILQEGHQYTLVIDRQWPDAHGNPLASEFRKKFRVVAPDNVQPAPARWRLQAPPGNTRKPLRVDFDEPLDHALLLSAIEVVDGGGASVPGEITLANQEKRWLFQPHEAWSAGSYRLVVDTDMEDRAGNSIARPFEVDLFERVEVRVKRETVAIPFQVKPAAKQ